jgi:hypothetical protein
MDRAAAAVALVADKSSLRTGILAMAITIGRSRHQRPRDGRNNRRGGLSVLEFLGCLIAIVGGAWLGAIYLGVDVRQLVYTSMAQSDVLDKMPPEWRPADPHKAFTREQMVATLREELGTLRTEIADLRRGGAPPADSRSDDRPERSATLQLSTSRTLAYWVRINEIVLGEAGLQHDADSALTEASAAKVFALKGRVSRFAAKAVTAIPGDQVDASVLQFGEQMAQWYDRGGELYERAAGIWELPVASQRTQLTRQWTQAELQHRNEGDLLGDKAAALRDVLNHRFGVEFPPFAASALAPGGRDTSEGAAG